LTDVRPDPRAHLDAQLDSPAREGLTGTAPTERYRPSADADAMTIAPDFRPADVQPAWRQDFPVDWPADQYVARRDFMKFMILTSVAFTAGQFWIAIQNWWRKRRGADPIVRIASHDEVAVGGTMVFRYPGDHDACILVRVGEREWVAYSQRCTHLSCAVIPVPAQGVFHCPCHEGVFDLRSGRPTAGPPRRPLPRIRLDVRGNDIYATGVEWRTT
jgi:nitrite reductase/ring-hydroxylating ferredoxin subunit